jgi:hypothetical protein
MSNPTSNYNWIMPEPTSLVTDLPADFEVFGQAVDTTVFNNAGAAVAKSVVDAKGDLIVGTADDTVDRLAVGTNGYILVADSVEATGLKWEAPSSGGALVLLNTTSFSAIASQSINDVFSSTFDNYRIVFFGSADSTRDIQVRLRVGGSDAQGVGGYLWHREASFSTTALNSDNTNTFWLVGVSDTVAKFPAIVDLGNPYLTEPTGIAAVGGRHTLTQTITGYHNLSTSYTGFTIFPNTGNMTGSVSVYGYGK